MAVYRNDDPGFLVEALRSLQTQTLQQFELVVVVDGPIPDSLKAVLRDWSERFPFGYKQIQLPQNLGLANALNAGLKECGCEWFPMTTSR